MTYSLQALAAARQQAAEATGPAAEPLPPLDAPDLSMGILAAWNGEAFVDYEVWQATHPIEREETTVPALWMGAEKYVAPGYTLFKDGERWLLKCGKRVVKGFVSAFLSHALRWADEAYGIKPAVWVVAKSTAAARPAGE